MRPWKRNLLIGYLACNLALVVVSMIYVVELATPLATALVALLATVVVMGILTGVRLVVRSLSQRQATLHEDADGAVCVERSALESTARRALQALDGIVVQKVSVTVGTRKGEPLIDFAVTAVPQGSESLMVAAGRIQSSVMHAVEAFTGLEVRHVAVNFVEPKSKVDAAVEKVPHAPAFGEEPLVEAVELPAAALADQGDEVGECAYDLDGPSLDTGATAHEGAAPQNVDGEDEEEQRDGVQPERMA